MDLYIALTFPAVLCKRTRTTFIDLRWKTVVPDPGAIASDRRKHQVPNNNVSAVANLYSVCVPGRSLDLRRCAITQLMLVGISYILPISNLRSPVVSSNPLSYILPSCSSSCSCSSCSCFAPDLDRGCAPACSC